MKDLEQNDIDRLSYLLTLGLADQTGDCLRQILEIQGKLVSEYRNRGEDCRAKVRSHETIRIQTH